MPMKTKKDGSEDVLNSFNENAILYVDNNISRNAICS